MQHELTPASGALPFHDILDGYFTLKQSVHQMMTRNHFVWANFTVRHAPIMDIAGLAPDAPVPLHLRDHHAGMIEVMVLTVLRAAPQETGEFILIGAGDWHWLNGPADMALPKDIRLGEPAYLTGFGMPTQPLPKSKQTATSDVLANVPTSLQQLHALRSFCA
jgi:hypothetical protein